MVFREKSFRPLPSGPAEDPALLRVFQQPGPGPRPAPGRPPGAPASRSGPGSPAPAPPPPRWPPLAGPRPWPPGPRWAALRSGNSSASSVARCNSGRRSCRGARNLTFPGGRIRAANCRTFRQARPLPHQPQFRLGNAGAARPKAQIRVSGSLSGTIRATDSTTRGMRLKAHPGPAGNNPYPPR